jgi:hypothetical protein
LHLINRAKSSKILRIFGALEISNFIRALKRKAFGTCKNSTNFYGCKALKPEGFGALKREAFGALKSKISNAQIEDLLALLCKHRNHSLQKLRFCGL